MLTRCPHPGQGADAARRALDEVHGGWPSTCQGRYWITGNGIDYLDDLGFWAFGEFRDGCLPHARHRFTRC